MRVFLALCFAGLATAAQAQTAKPSATMAEGERCRIIVLNLQGKGLPPKEKDIPALLTDTLAGELSKVAGCHIITQQDVGQMLDVEASKAECGDGSDSCLSEIGTALGADRVVGGSVGKIGSEFVISVRLLNTSKGTVDARAEQAVAGDPAQLRLAARNVGRRLFGQKELPPDAPEDSSPLMADDGASAGVSPMLIAGGVVGGVGLLAGMGGVALAIVANQRLNDASVADKGAIRTQGLLAVGVAVLGGAMVLTGGALVGVALFSE